MKIPHWPRRLVVAIVLAHLLLAALIIQMIRSDRLPGGEGIHERTEFLMDTIVKAEIHSEDAAKAGEALSAAFADASRLEVILDRHRAQSEVNQINVLAGEEPAVVSEDTIQVIRLGLELGNLTLGAFDITIAPLMEQWGFGTADVDIPDNEDIARVLPLVDYSLVQLNAEGNQVFLAEPGMRLDLSGIAKGYIVDRAVEALIEAGVTSGSFNAGGDIRLIGEKPDGSAWRIGITHPRPQQRRDLIAVVELRNSAIVTSGDYERYFLVDGERYHHILDPDTGMPARGIISATVIAPDAVTADALSTALFVMGLERGMELIESLPEVEALIVTEDEELHLSTGLQGKVEIL